MRGMSFVDGEPPADGTRGRHGRNVYGNPTVQVVVNQEMVHDDASHVSSVKHDRDEDCYP